MHNSEGEGKATWLNEVE